MNLDEKQHLMKVNLWWQKKIGQRQYSSEEDLNGGQVFMEDKL